MSGSAFRDWFMIRWAELGRWADAHPATNLRAWHHGFVFPPYALPPQGGAPSYFHVSCAVDPSDVDAPDPGSDCLAAVTAVLDILSTGRRTFVRVAPELMRDTNFGEAKERVRGYVRFTVTEQEGGIEPSDQLEIPSLVGRFRR